jgi:hypothetical protein
VASVSDKQRSKCGSEVPYISRRCIAVEDAKGTLIVFGKQVKLLDVCLKCLGELYGNPQLDPGANDFLKSNNNKIIPKHGTQNFVIKTPAAPPITKTA